ncbi:MAG: class III poly(R)-hydroxyalkanoic acid synthase subunit PhaC, partial [Acidobacteriota bacterium]
EIARTPSQVIYYENKLKIRRYLPVAKKLLPIPLLIINSLVNKYYILDLTPGKSYVEYLLKEGFDVYMLDWGTPDESDCTTTLEDHVNRYLAHSVRAVLDVAQAKKISLVGYCMGGTMSLMYAALHGKLVQNLVLLAAPVDFHNNSLLSLWGRPEFFNVDRLVDTCGNIPFPVLQSVFMMLKPMKNFTKYVHLLENIDNEEYVKTFLAFDYWVNDGVAVAGETFRQFIKDAYHYNLLVQNRLRLGKRTINLKNVKCAVLNVVAQHDDIVPPRSTEVLMDLIGSEDKELLRVNGGHHGLSIGPSALKIVWPKSAQWLRDRS